MRAAPVPLVHEDIFRTNSETLWSIANSAGKRLRVATKSLRVPALIEIVTGMGPHPPSLMCYSVKEAAFLIDWSASTGKTAKFNDILIAYPTVNTQDVLLAHRLTHAGHQVVLMIDSVSHINKITAILENVPEESRKTKLSVCMDVDCSLRFLGLHLGAHRSPIHSAVEFEVLLLAVKKEESKLRLAGVMTYEAQIAGVGDASRHAPFLMNHAIRAMKSISKRHVRLLRANIHQILLHHGVKLDFFNGGGTGNLEEAASDPSLTEVTAGSGFMQPELFDYYLDNVCAPALTIALQVTRIQSSHRSFKHPGEEIADVICCQSGGFISSGPTKSDKAPSVFLPTGLSPFADEGFGEVQTPLKVGRSLQNQGLAPKIGDYVLIRPAKSGEITERFPKILYISAETSSTQPPQVLITYRGYGKAFY